MRRCVITFRSVTPAQRGEGVLHKAGIECNLQRTPRWMEAKGCGYSLQLNCSDVVSAVEALRRRGIVYQKVYLYKQQDEVEELDL